MFILKFTRNNDDNKQIHAYSDEHREVFVEHTSLEADVPALLKYGAKEFTLEQADDISKQGIMGWLDSQGFYTGDIDTPQFLETEN